MGVFYEDRFRVIFNSLQLDTEFSTESDRDSSDWTITFSNEDLTSAQVFKRKGVFLGTVGFRPLNFLEVSNTNDKDYMRLLLFVDKKPWNYQAWTGEGNYLSPWQSEKMGDYGKIVGAKKDSWRGDVGEKVQVKVEVKASGFPNGQTGYDTIAISNLFQNLYKYGEEGHEVALSNHCGRFKYSILPEARRTEPIKKRHLARAGTDPVYQIQQLSQLKLPSCCLDVLVQIQWRVKVHNRVQKSLKYKNWAEKVIDPGWITDTAKKLREEAKKEVKSILKPPKDTDISLDGQIIMMSALLLANDLRGLSMHYTDHTGDLEELWTEVYIAFDEWSDGLAEKASQNVEEKILQQVLRSADYKQKR
jgi:hypothetical protein